MPIQLEYGAEPVPGYRLIERLGRGGFGEVWKAEAPGGLFKAMKFAFGTVGAVPEGGETSHANQELKALSRVREIRHPFILSMERYDIIEGQLIITTELADRNLDDRLKECQKQGLPGIPRAELLKYLYEAAEALDLMSTEYDLQHLDIKPQNLFLVRSHVKVADFGLVKDLEGFAAKVTGGVTPVYAAPETFDGWVSRATDQYSLAIVYEELLTGKRPFAGPTSRQLMMQHLMSEPDLSPLPAHDRPFLTKALAKDPSERYPSCLEFIEELREVTQTESGRIRSPRSAPDSTRQRESLRPALEPEEINTPRVIHEMTDTAEATASFSEAVSFEDIPVEIAAEGALVPTLLIGVGKTGLRFLEKVRGKLHARFGDPAKWPPVRLLGLDCDPQALRDVQRCERITADSYDQLLVCKLRKPTRYFQKWNELKHLASWIDPNCLFQITAGGATNGYRPIGRLAFVDNYRRIQHRIRHELEVLASKDFLEGACEATGLSLRHQRPRIYIAAAMGGGAGSGMFIDLCYLVRKILREGGISKPDIQGMLVAGVARVEKNRDLRSINHYALAQNLLDLSRSDAEFTAKYEADGGEEHGSGPPAEAIYFFDQTAEQVAEPKDHVVLDTMAEFVCQTTTKAAGAVFDARAERENWPAFRSVGWFSLTYPRQEMYRQTAGRLCQTLVSQWQEPLSPREENETAQSARITINDPIFSAESVSVSLADALAEAIGAPFSKLAEAKLATIREQIKAAKPAEMGRVCQESIDEIKKLVGLDPEETEADFDQIPLLDQKIRDATRKTAGDRMAVLISAMSDALNQPGARLERVRVCWEAMQQAFLDRVDRQKDFASAKQRLVVHRLAEVREKAKAPGSGFLAHPLIGALQRYVDEKVDFRIADQLGHAFRLLKSRIADRARDLISIRQQFDHLIESCRVLREQTSEGELGFCEQTLFPGGMLMLSDSVETWYQVMLEQITMLEETLEARTFAPRGGLWSACTSREGSTGLAVNMLEEATQWVAEGVPPADVAQFFFERHREEPAGMPRELRGFFDWSCPSVTGNPSNSDSVGVQEYSIVVVPDSDTGREFFETLKENAPEIDILPVFTGEQCLFCRISAHASLGRFLPVWILRAKALYEAACKTRTSPEVFPDFAKT